jgi:hypothetical protein
MIRAALEFLNGLKPVALHEIDGKQFSTEQLVKVPTEFSKPIVPAIEINSLTGIVDFINENVDKIKLDETVIHVENYDSVHLISKTFGDKFQRHSYISAGIKHVLEGGFAYGHQYEIENFIIAMQTHFVPSKTIDDILNYLACIKVTGSSEIKDTGVAQNMTVKTHVGSAQVEDRDVPNPVTLQPYRTFLELEQPESKFVFRLKGNEGFPTCSIHEADSGKWKLDAIKSIKLWLIEQEIKIPIIA